jgi:acyl transferase domain-containing protein/acyl carrier protein
MNEPQKVHELNGTEIAIIGMSCRFPGAQTPQEFWKNLCAGVESLTLLTAEDLRRGGLDPQVLEDPRYVPYVPTVDNVEFFDAGFFGYTPLEAKLMDPQHRLFLECAWEAFEHAGHLPETHRGKIGVFTGAKTNTYLFNLFSNQEFFQSLDHFQIALGNDLACMATRIAYKFDLRGPSYSLHTACSTSLIAVHLACQSLLLGECDMALAGGAAINVPQHRGYFYQKGGILSPDGSCRTFDAEAQGSNFGNGVGAVVLKRLDDALADGDHISAVIRGSATNNDGAQKASFTAPGVEGQTAVLLEAMAAAGVEPETISYIEAHGTATDLGDAIEILALTEAFRSTSESGIRCALGSVKTNIGHLETAAGVAGLIKTALSLEHRQLPPTLHFTQPNPKINFADSSFYVNTQLSEWEDGATPRRAGVSSFGIGSANAHVILEEAPPQAASSPTRPWQLLLLSARSEAALDAASVNLAGHLQEQAQLTDRYLADVAYTLQTGRKHFLSRRAAVCGAQADAESVTAALSSSAAFTQLEGVATRQVAFLFPGLGDHYPRMGQELYRTEPTFREHLDRGAQLLQAQLGFDIREVLYPQDGEANAGKLDFRRMLRRDSSPEDEAARRLDRTSFIQPVTFLIEYALAQLWMEWGVQPQALIGYSIGEYVAACLSGVLSFEDALSLVARRAQMIEELPAGAMLAVPLGEAEVAPFLQNDALSLAAVNGPASCVLSGTVAAIEAVEHEMQEQQIPSRRLLTTHAFHSKMTEPLAARLTELVRTFKLGAPQIPYISNVTGTWIKPEEATDPGYWARHMSGAVRFSEGIGELVREQARVLLEVGPGQGLTSFVKQHPDCDGETARLSFATLPGAYNTRPESAYILETLGKLWLVGQPVDWSAFYAREKRRRVPLPTYPFERQRYWVDAPNAQLAPSQTRHVTLDKNEKIAEWFYQPAWKPSIGAQSEDAAGQSRWLIFSDTLGLGASIAEQLRRDGQDVLTVFAGDEFRRGGEREFFINPRRAEDYTSLLSNVNESGSVRNIVHLWSISDDAAKLDANSFQQSQDLGFYSLLFLAQALGRKALSEQVRIEVITHEAQRITGRETLRPENATLVGPARVIPQEFPKVECRCIDVAMPEQDIEVELEALGQQLISEFQLQHDGSLVAYRDGRRWAQDFEPVLLESEGQPTKLKESGVYLLTGGMGGLGLTLAEHLARKVKARLVLTGRTALPEREGRTAWLETHATDDPVSEKIRAVMRLEELGAEVLTVAADASDETQMRRAIEEATERFGTIHGVIHLAGQPGGGIIQLKTREMAEQIFDPKVKGALVIAKLFEERELDFLVIYSSIASVLGEFGQADYCGANAFLDAFAQARSSSVAANTVVINWDIWQEAGLAVHTEVPPHLRQWRQEMLAKGILNSEGVEAFERILASGLPQVVVSTQDLPGRIELGKSFTGESFLEQLRQTGETQTHSSRRVLGTGYVAAGSNLEQQIAEVWQRVLGTEQVGVNDNFFDLGGNSLLGLQLVSELSRALDIEIAPVTLFEFPSVNALARHLNPQPAESATTAASELSERNKRLREGAASSGIAIIGVAGRFPGAPSVEQLWSNLCEGLESVTFFTDEELLAAGVPRSQLDDPRYVKAGAVLEDIDQFDAELFGFSPREAEVMDPQHKLFLECAWEVLERAGYDPSSYEGSVGVFAGSNLSTYLLRMHADPKVRESVNMLQAILGNDKDSLTTMVSYKLNLRGPSIAIQTFCSTSLVAVHIACQSLRRGECSMALAGGVRVVVPAQQGYLYERGGIAPSDGHTRSFDAKADGSILGNGVGIVCLKRLEDALADGDHIHAVIKGSAINNDGSLKAGYTAPSVAGQADAILAAMDEAGVEPESIGYIEAHGSATELGDPIELAALTKAFRARTSKKSFCPIGSVKSNFGHLDRAAGVTALIKTALSLERKQIPPSINFEESNPQIDFANSPFYVNTSLAEWSANGETRRACVNSLGMGGTNAHVIVEEAPPVEPSSEGRPWQLLLLSAKTEAALDAATGRLAAHLAQHPELNPSDVAYTLQVGRRDLEFRRAIVCNGHEDARRALEGAEPGRVLTAYQEEGERDFVFMFPGLGGQYVNMGRGLYESEPTFKKDVDACCELLLPLLGFDLRKELYPEAAPAGSNGEKPASSIDLRKMLGRKATTESDERINETSFTQPLLFVIEYALARLWMEWGIRPKAMVGYSLGEYVAACLAGVISLEDSLKLVAERSRMIEELPPGALLAVGLSEEGVLPLLGEELSLMATNSPEQCVVSGAVEAIEALRSKLDAQGTSYRQLSARHAFHSRMMEPIYDAVVSLAQSVKLSPPQIPYLSNVTGTWIRPEEATDPSYWARHLCQPVRFSEGIQELLKDRRCVLLEVGASALSSIVLQYPLPPGAEPPLTVNLLRHSYETQSDLAYTLQALGKLWLLGARPDWTKVYAQERRRRVLLPAYPFQRQRYWIDAQVDRQYVGQQAGVDASQKEWFYVPSWKRTAGATLKGKAHATNGRDKWWVLVDESGLGNELADALEGDGRSVLRLHAGSGFARTGASSFNVSPSRQEDYAALVNEAGGLPDAVVHLWDLSSDGGELHAAHDGQSGSSLLALSRALQEQETVEALPVWVVSEKVHDVIGEEMFQPSQASLLGACTNAAKESPKLSIRNLDVVVPGQRAHEKKRLVAQLLGEMTNGVTERVVAYRGGHRWIPTLAPESANGANGRDSKPAEPRTYLLINGLSTLGADFCKHFAREAGHRLVLVEPAEFPARELWDEWVANDPGEGLITARIKRLRALDEQAEIVLLGAELTDEAQARALPQQVKERFGSLDGVLYVLDDEPLSTPADEHAPEALLRDKAQGLVALDEALRDEDLSCRLLISQTRTDGLLSAADYALRFFVDAFARDSAGNGHQHWTSVTWDIPPSNGNGQRPMRAIERLLHLGSTQVIVSDEPLAEGWNKLEALMNASVAKTESEPITLYPRPTLRVAYVAPRTPTEQSIAQIWSELLGVEQIGAHDSFLALGGDSLLAVRLISRLRDVFNQDIPLRLIFEASTVAELAKAVEPRGAETEDSELAQIMSMLEQLSEEDAEQELLKRQQAPNSEATA